MLHAAREKWIFGLILFALVFPRAGTKIFGIPVTVGSLLLAVLFMAWLVSEKQAANLRTGILPPVHAVFLIYVTLVTIGMAVFKFDYPLLHRLTVILPIFVPLVVYYIAYPTAAGWFADEARIIKMLKVLALANIFIGVYGLLQYFVGHYRVMVPGLTISWADAQIPDVFATKSNLMWDGQALKVTSTFQNGNIFGVYLAMTNPVIAAGFLAAKTKTEKLLFGMACLVSLYNVPITLARSAFFGSSVALFILFLLRKPVRDKIYTAAMFLYMLAVVFTRERLFERLIVSFFDPSLGERREGIVALSMSAEGVADFMLGSLFKQGHLIAESFFQRASENIYVTFFWWFGVVGVILFLLACYHVLAALFRCIRFNRAEHDKLELMAHGLFAGILAYLIMAIIEGALYMPPTGINFWFLLGLASVVSLLVKNREASL
ncbi:MAG: O-antigen ligase family protein [Bacillota bacterium]